MSSDIDTHFRNRLYHMLHQNRGNEWLYYEHMEAYIRIGSKMLPLAKWRQVSCVQLANLTTPPHFQGKDTFTRMLAEIMDMTDRPIYVEQLLNTNFKEALLRRGFVPARSYDGVVHDVVLLRGLT